MSSDVAVAAYSAAAVVVAAAEDPSCLTENYSAAVVASSLALSAAWTDCVAAIVGAVAAETEADSKSSCADQS